MPAETKVKNKHTQPVILDADQLADFKAAIGQDISGYFRQIQYDVVKAYREEKEKNVKPLVKGALINYVINKPNKYYSKDQKQSTLDIFAKEPELISFLDQLKKDKNDAAISQLGRNGQLMQNICKTYFRKPQT